MAKRVALLFIACVLVGITLQMISYMQRRRRGSAEIQAQQEQLASKNGEGGILLQALSSILVAKPKVRGVRGDTACNTRNASAISLFPAAPTVRPVGDLALTGAQPQTQPRMMCNSLLNVFTTFIEHTQDPRKISAQMTVLASYQNLRPLGIQAWLFTTSDSWDAKARQHEVRVVRRFLTNENGTPCLAFMYRYVALAMNSSCGTSSNLHFDAYVNGDIIFTRSIVDTLSAVRRRWRRPLEAGMRRGVMIVGKRTNSDYRQQPLKNDSDILALAANGKTANSDAQDYFIFSRGALDWDRLPGFVVGRRAYDNWMVDNAFHDGGLDLIDASHTILAVHLTCADGNSAGHAKGSDNDHNIRVHNPVTGMMVGPHEWYVREETA